MKIKPSLYLLCLLVTLATGNRAQAQSTEFLYQGRLDLNGVPANGTYDIAIGLFTSLSGGSGVPDTTTNYNVSVTNGLFNAFAGSFVLNGIFNGADWYLEISVATNGSSTFTTLSPRQKIMRTPYAIYADTTKASGLIGTISANNLVGTYNSPLALVNPNNTFSGNGGNLTNVSAATLGGLNSASFWKVTGNSGTLPGTQYLGTADNQPLELHVNGVRALRIEPNGAGVPNMVGGYFQNTMIAGAAGIIGGGGTSGSIQRVTGQYGAILGGHGNEAGNFGFIGGGAYNSATGFASVVVGGIANVAAGESSVVGGGTNNQALNSYVTVGGGYGNNASGFAATIAGGFHNTADQLYAAIGGGIYNRADGPYSTIGGGINNRAVGDYTTVGGGANNHATNFNATVPGGIDNIAGGQSSFAAGNQAKALHDGSFVWADSQGADFSSTAANQFSIRAKGGVRISDDTTNLSFGSTTRQMLNLWGTQYGIGVQGLTLYFRTDNADANNGFIWYRGGVHNNAYANPGGGTEMMHLVASGLYVNGTFVSASDRNLKENFQTISAREILEKVSSLPLTRWNYTNDPATMHVGPMAQDFYAAFGVGPDDKHIATIDESGVALAAIQGLNQKLAEQTSALRSKDSEIQELRQAIVDLQQAVRKINHQTKP